MKTDAHHRRFSGVAIVVIAVMLTALFSTGCARKKPMQVRLLDNPAAEGSICPNETRTGDGGVVLSWLEPSNDSLALRFAIRRPNLVFAGNGRSS